MVKRLAILTLVALAVVGLTGLGVPPAARVPDPHDVT